MFGVWDFQDDEMGLKKLKCDLGSAVMQRGEELFRRRFLGFLEHDDGSLV